MPEIKNTFIQGKMNKDLDERIIPNGQYKDALNIKVNSSDDASVGTVQNIKGNLARDTAGIVPGDYLCIATIADEKSNKLYWFVTKELVPFHAILQYDIESEQVTTVLLDKNNDTLKFTTSPITGINIIDNLLFWTDGVNEPKKINIDDCIKGTDTGDLDTSAHTVLVDNDGFRTAIPIEEQNITVIKKAPRLAPKTTILPNYDALPVLFEKVFPRFSYRYKYKDGEYSSFGPFTNVIFKPVYKDDFNADTAYSLEEGNNVGMVNNIKAIQFSNFNYENLPENVVQVELLYKEEGSSIVFSVKKINEDDYEWTQNKFVLESQDIFAAIPENQLLRVWDNVPKKALAQEITGNRVVYGNYTQGHDLITGSGTRSVSGIVVDYENRNLNYFPINDDFALGGIPSLKSQREYNIGLVWGDKYGRETSILDSTGNVKVPWSDAIVGLSASKSTSLKINVTGEMPYWADYYKFYVKEKSGEYYNLLMEKAYFQDKVNIFEKAEERIWLGFISSDRNKLQDQEYIILKKKVGANETQVNLENKFKILDIVNEAPDAIKHRYVDLGKVKQTSFSNTDYLNSIFPDNDQRPNAEIDMLYIDRSTWVNGLGGSLQQKNDNAEMWVENLYTSWNDGTQISERYRIVSSVFNGAEYMLKLDRKISSLDASIALGSATSPAMSDDLEFLIQKREDVEIEELAGKFFVQISSLSAVQPGENVTIENYIVAAEAKTHWFYNPTSALTLGEYPPPAIEPNEVDDDIANHVGSLTNTVTDAAALITSAFSDATDFPAGRGFFIDSLFLVAGQNSDSNYAKSTGRTWLGRADTHRPTPIWDNLNTSLSNTINTHSHGWGIHKLYDVNGNYTGERRALVDYIFDSNGDSISGSNNAWEQGQVLNNDPTNYIGIKQSMQGFLTTDSSHVANVGINGFRRFKNQGDISTNTPSYWNGGLEHTYGTQAGVHYIEISFMAPGVDLHDGSWGGLVNLAPNFGNESIGAYLQAIWGGGVFNDVDHMHDYPNDTLVIEMEGNYDPINNDPLPSAPGPGVGYGYDTSGSNQEKHQRQWDPTYPSDPGGEIQKFIQNLAAGRKFIFSSNPDVEFEILANPKIKKLYNHTTWNRDYHWDGTQFLEVSSTRCVQREVLQWARATTGSKPTRMAEVKTCIENFGKANNRRITYIFPVDKNPMIGSNSGITAGPNGNFDSNSPLDIQFITNDSSLVLAKIMTEPAIWETEPKEDGLDIYYEASEAIPTKLTNETNVDFAPIGCYVDIATPDAARNGQYIITGKMVLVRWTADDTFRVANRDQEGFNAFSDNAGTVIDYTGALARFYRRDGSYTTAKILGPASQGEVEDLDTGVPYIPTTDYYNEFIVETDVNPNYDTGISYYNCFTFGNGIESDRIRDDFNNPTLTNGVKASIVLESDYKEEHRKSGLIFSGIYNSNSGVNNLNQFIMAENITKDLNPTYGSIQKLFQRRISLVAFCEDKVVSITSNKDALFNADGNAQLVSTNAVLGDATPFVGDFGISKNPESFAKESYRAYFADKQRGAVLRLSMDGITDISNAGMDDYFRDNLKNAGQIIGSYDAYNKDFNITLRSRLASENLLLNAYLDDGLNSNLSIPGQSQELIVNGSVNNSSSLVEPRLSLTISGNSLLNNRYLDFKTEITNYAEQAIGSIAPETTSYSPQQESATSFVTGNSTPGQSIVYMFFKEINGVNWGDPFETGVGNGYHGNNRKYTALRNYYSPYVIESENGTQSPLAYPFPTYATAKSDNFYPGFGPSDPTANIGPSSDIFWNPIRDGFGALGLESPYGTPASHRNPWFNTTTNPNNGWGIVFDKTSSTQELILPGTKKNSVDETTPTLVLNKYPSAVPTTVFNGEEVRIIFYARGMSYTTPNSPQTGSPSDHYRYLTIQLYDGTTALTDAVLMDPTSVPGGISQGYADYKYVPVPGTSQGTADECRIGFQTTTGVNFPTLEHNTTRAHDVSFKFTNGVDESEAIIVQDLQVHIKFVDDDGNEPDELYGSIESFAIQKRHYMSDVDTFTMIGSSNGDMVPGEIIPAFAQVEKIGFTWWSLQDEFQSISEIGFQAKSSNTFGSNYTAVTNTYTQTYVDINGNTQTNTGTYLTPPDPSGTNGVVDFGDYADGYQIVNDKFVYDNPGNNHYLKISNTTTTGNWYAIALMRVYASNSGNLTNSPGDGIPPTGDAPSLEYYNETFVLTQVPYEFVEGNALHPAYLCIFQGDDTISEIKIKLPGNLDAEFETINMIDISATWSGGVAPNWIFNLGAPGNPYPPHAWDVPKVDTSDSDGIVFNNTGGGYISALQNLGNLGIIPGGYILTFDAVVTNSALSFRLLDNNGAGQHGVDVIDRTGAYRIALNVDNGVYDVEIDEVNNGNTYPGTFQTVYQTQVAVVQQSGNWPCIIFHDGSGFQGSIDNISIVNAQNIYSGGSADAFTFSGPPGWDPTIDPFIAFNNNRIEFNNCPGVQPTAPISFYQLAQEIDPTLHPTALGEKYKIRFDHDFSTGAVNGYYDNSDGDGFIIGSGAITGAGTYNVIHTIGDHVNPNPSVYLTNTLVIYSNSGVGVTNGFIDNILFRQEFATGFEETVTFSEDVRGWVSRKSFVPEQGTSLSSSYFTFNTGRIYEHNIESEPRNNFYGVQYKSTITAMLNSEPSTVKSFNTLNYEGTQSKVNQFINTTIDGNNYNTLSNYNIVDKEGWHVTSINTDKQEGYVSEFIEKEGKWFNYIKGNEKVNTSDLSFQGLGTIKEVL